MCGIFFYSDTNKINYDKAVREIKSITQTIKKRGPDHQILQQGKSENSFWVGLNTVLAIRTSKSTISPALADSNKSRFFAYNGETFEPGAIEVDDTKLFNEILERSENSIYESQFYQGYFAYAKLTEDHLAFGLDNLSEKNLFYWKDGSSLCLSSDIKSILLLLKTLGKRIELNKSKCKEYFLTRHLIQFNQTIYQDIFKCLPGDTYKYHFGSKTLTSSDVINNVINSRTYLERLYNNSCKDLKHLTVEYIDNVLADLKGRKDIGYIVSGGVDSSYIAMQASKIFGESAKSMKFFTLTFGEKDQPAKLASSIIKGIGTSHKIIDLDKEAYRSSLENLYLQLSIPMPTHSFASYSTLCKNVVDEGCRVLVGGECADEIYTGYLAYKNFHKNNLSSSNGSLSPYSSLSDQFNLFDNEKEEIESASDIHLAYEALASKGMTIMERIELSLFLDAYIQAPSTGLFCVDQVGGLWGIESRSPLANPKALAWRSMNLRDMNPTNFYDGKKILCDLLSELSASWAEISPTKQGFSGYPNEAFDSQELTFCGQLVSDCLDINYDNIARNYGSRDFDWKIINFGKFMQINKYLIGLS